MNVRRYRIDGEMKTEMRQNTSMIGREVRADMRGLFEIEGHKLNGARRMHQQRPSSHHGITLLAAIAMILAIALAVPAVVNAATSGPNNPTTGVVSGAIAGYTWSNPGNVLAPDNLYATTINMSNGSNTRYL
ncbi:MAG: hypothetical protein HZB31_05850, partial [Nitrospirae bacterium]|nr:hypothetical protein [Nitrospirota bacterium]